MLFSGCTTTRDTSKLNHDPRCFYQRDLLAINDSFYLTDILDGKYENINGGSDVRERAYSFDDREFYKVYNKRGYERGYQDIYGNELTVAESERLFPYATNKFSWWDYLGGVALFKREDFLAHPNNYPGHGTPYRALPRPEWCDTSIK